MPIPTPMHSEVRKGMARLNELGVPDFRGWRVTTEPEPTPPSSSLSRTSGFTPPCPHCQYPMLLGEVVCGRCGRSRA